MTSYHKNELRAQSLASAEEMLTMWGMAQTGRMQTARPRGWKSTQGESDIDEFALAAAHVEKFFQLHDNDCLRSVAAHRYVKGEPPESYRWQAPGESPIRALIRHGCGFLIEANRSEVPHLLLRHFARRFCAWYRTNPGPALGQIRPRAQV